MMEQTTPQHDKVFSALAKAQTVITSPPRNREVEVRTKSGSSYKFKYATLDAVIDHVREALTSNGLWFTQTLANGDGKYKLITRLVHASGQYIESETPLLVQGQGNQEFGSALSYMRRYALTAMLGIAADEDDDANKADGNTIEKSAERKGNGQQFGGPLTKTDLKKQMRAFSGDLAACTDMSEYDALLVSHKALLEQCERDLPDWWEGDGIDHKGAVGAMENKRKELQDGIRTAR